MMDIEKSQTLPTYSPPFYQFNGHLQTIIPGLFRNVSLQNNLIRERWDTPDGDFLDVDWLKGDRKRLVILSHGLEGDSRRPYMIGMMNSLFSSGYTILAWNFRSCSGELNRKPRFYHSGATEDLHFIISEAIKRDQPDEIYLIGFSLGGNLTLKYLGENVFQRSTLIKSAIAISVPIDLASSSSKMKRIENRMYEIRFLKSLKWKVKEKEKLMPGHFDLGPLNRITHLWEFDDYYTGPIHGFRDASDYYQQCSAINFLSQIKIPTLLINASNDPFLSDQCFPDYEEIDNTKIETIYPVEGGHCGFYMGHGNYWTEKLAIEFLENG